MQKQYVISVTSKDKPGIIFTVAEAVKKVKGDIKNLSQTVLDGYFSMVLFATANDTIPASTIKKEISNALSKHSEDPAEIIIIPLDSKFKTENTQVSNTEPEDNNEYVLTVSSTNSQNLVYKISKLCKESNINVLNLYTQILKNTYTMIFLLDLKNSIPIQKVRCKINELSENEPDIKIMLQHYKIFKATNDIKLQI